MLEMQGLLVDAVAVVSRPNYTVSLVAVFHTLDDVFIVDAVVRRSWPVCSSGREHIRAILRSLIRLGHFHVVNYKPLDREDPVRAVILGLEEFDRWKRS